MSRQRDEGFSDSMLDDDVVLSRSPVSLGQPDYGVDDTGWRPRNHTLRVAPQPGVLGDLQAEHDPPVHIKTFPSALNLRLVVDSQDRVSSRLANLIERSDLSAAERWQRRAATYCEIKQHLRNVGGIVGKAGRAVAAAATATARVRTLSSATLLKPSVEAGFQSVFSGIDDRVEAFAAAPRL